MEAACFLSSSSSLLPPIKSNKTRSIRPPSSSISKSKQFRFCAGCELGQSDEEIPRVTGDWRSFRARLVATEQTPIIPDLAIGEKWAHPLLVPEKGCLLIASEKLNGVHIFEKTVILLLSTGPVGPTGIILNRPSLMSIKETRSSVFDVAGRFSDRALNFGGPLEEGLFLFGPGSDPGPISGVFDEVMKGVYYGTKESVGCAAEMVKRDVVGAEDFRFFDGYCGWEKEQLQEEIRAGYWTLAACSPTVIGLDLESPGLWDEVLGLMGPKKVW